MVSTKSTSVFIVLLNVLIIYLLVGLIFLGVLERSPTFQIAFFSLFGVSFWIFFIPFIGKLKLDASKTKKLILFIFIMKVMGVVIMEAFHFFLGAFDFNIFTKNALLYLEGQKASYIQPWGTIVLNYPPGTSYMWLFLLLINPTKSTLLFRIYLIVFESLICYMIFKISKLKKFQIPDEKIFNGIIYSSLALSFIVQFDVYGKPDCLIILITLVGYYLIAKDRYILGSFVFSFAGYIKLYSFFWLIGIGIVFLKRRKFKDLSKMIVGFLAISAIIIPIDYYFQKLDFFLSILKFSPQLSEEYIIYNQNIWFYLLYTGIPGMNVLPYVLMMIVLVYFCLKWENGISPGFFASIMAIVLIFYPALNNQY
ncbi:MAG: hypothetical protein ACTSVI_01140, partial [Promethearchaeota archaeon]